MRALSPTLPSLGLPESRGAKRLAAAGPATMSKTFSAAQYDRNVRRELPPRAASPPSTVGEELVQLGGSDGGDHDAEDAAEEGRQAHSGPVPLAEDARLRGPARARRLARSWVVRSVARSLGRSVARRSRRAPRARRAAT